VLLNLELSDPAESAGGWGAIKSTTLHVQEEAGVVRGSKALLKVNQEDGFDCPGCAWPEPSNRTHFEFCENGAKAIASETTTERAGRAFFAKHSVKELLAWTDRDLNRAGRLTEPMIWRTGASHYEPLSWEDAFEAIAGALNALDTPDEAVFYTSGRTSNEAAFLYQLFVRDFGTNNLPDCSNMCHESSGTGLTETIGIGKGTVHLEDFRESDLVLVIGQNPGTNHPRMLTTLQAAKRNGTEIVSVNPLREAGLVAFNHPQEAKAMLGLGDSTLASTFVPVRINGDVAFLNGVMKAMLELDASGAPGIDHEFIRERTSGFDGFAAGIREATWSDLAVGAGVGEDAMRELGAKCLASEATIICWAMGLTQHENGVANVQSVVNLLLLGGHFGRPGAGACPVRGHSNVQGDRTVGIWERPPQAFLDRLENHFGIRAPREHGYDVIAAIEAMHAGKAKVFFAMGGNFLSASPDTHYTAEALQSCEMTVAVSTKLNRGHLVAGKTAIILPCIGRTEVDSTGSKKQLVSVENSMGYVHASRGLLKPASKRLLSEPAIVAGLAKATLGQSEVPWDDLISDYATTRDGIEKCVPGFQQYNERLNVGGFYLPNGVHEGEFPTDTGKAKFTAHAAPSMEMVPGELLMMTVRSHDQYNTTVYGNDDRYRGVRKERRVIFMAEADIAERGLRAEQPVDISSHFGGRERRVENFLVVPYEIPLGCCATYFPETNPLVPIDQFAKGSRTPASKSVRVRVHAR
jgi:molybdopterin-dependent oxidoreductase alpha subunit